MSKAVDSVTKLPIGSDVLRVTTFNVLAPVWCHQSVYPGMDMAEFDPGLRRKHQLETILRLDMDILFMQECQKTELDLLLEADGGKLSRLYDVEFCPFPLTFWTNWLTDTTNYEPRENGVCILIRRAAMSRIRAEHVPIDLPEWKKELPEHSLGAHACFMWVKVPRWQDAEVLLVTSHLDAESSYRAGLQCRELAVQIKDRATISRSSHVIWGGDFNMEIRNCAIKDVKAEGFCQAAGAKHLPTVINIAATVHVDQVLVNDRSDDQDESNDSSASSDEGLVPQGALRSCNAKIGKPEPLEPLATYVPVCPSGYCIPVLPFLSELQWLMSSSNGERGTLVQALTIIFLIIFLPVIVLVFSPVLVYRCDRKRQCQRLSWALQEIGSDHLPVTVAIRRRTTEAAVLA